MRLFYILLTSLLILLQDFALAGDLDALLQSRSFSKLEQNSNRANRRIFDDGKNYTRLFTREHKKTNFLLQWLGLPTEDYTSEEEQHVIAKTYVGATRTFYGLKNLRKFYLTILVPKPDLISSVEYGLLPEFSQFDYLKEKAESIQDGKIVDQPFRLYKIKETGACSLVVKLVKGVLLNLQVSSCNDKDELLKLASLLDIQRTVNKLQS